VLINEKFGSRLAAATAMFIPYLIRSFKDKWILFVATGGYGMFISLGFLDAKYTIIPSKLTSIAACCILLSLI